MKKYFIPSTVYYIKDNKVYSTFREEDKELKSLNENTYLLYGRRIKFKTLLNVAQGKIENPFLDTTGEYKNILTYEEVINNPLSGVHGHIKTNLYEATIGVGIYDPSDKVDRVLGLGYFDTEKEATVIYKNAIKDLKEDNFDLINYARETGRITK